MPQVMAQMEFLKTITCAASYTEVVRRAVAFHDLAVSHWRAGGEIILRHKDGAEERIVTDYRISPEEPKP
jgi:hypothetical protein